MISSAQRDILDKQRKRGENPLPPAIIREQRAIQLKNYKIIVINHLLLVVKRSLTVIRVSPPILPSSSKQKNQETGSNYFCTNGNSNNSNNDESNIIKIEPIDGTGDDMVGMSYDLYLVGIGSKGGEITLCNEDGVAIEQARVQGDNDHITGVGSLLFWYFTETKCLLFVFYRYQVFAIA